MSLQTDSDLRARLAGVAEISPSGLTVHDEAVLRGPLMDDLVFEAVFNARRRACAMPRAG